MPEEATPKHSPGQGAHYDPPLSEIGEPHTIRLIAAWRDGGGFKVVAAAAWLPAEPNGNRGLVFTPAATAREQDQLFERIASTRDLWAAFDGLRRASRWEVVTPQHYRIEATDPQEAAREGLLAAGLELRADDIPTSDQ
jgi:hypothetical protein